MQQESVGATDEGIDLLDSGRIRKTDSPESREARTEQAAKERADGALRGRVHPQLDTRVHDGGRECDEQGDSHRRDASPQRTCPYR